MDLASWKDGMSIAGLALTAVTNGYFVVQNIRKPEKRPHIVTMSLLAVLTGMAGIAQLQAGAGLAASVSLLTALFNAINAVTGWSKGGRKDFTRYAKICSVLTVATGAAWYLSGDPLIASIMLTAASVVSYVPTVEKIQREPWTEMPSRFAVNIIRYVLATFGVATYSWAAMLYPASWIVMNCGLLAYQLYCLRQQKLPEAAQEVKILPELPADDQRDAELDAICRQLGIGKYNAARPDMHAPSVRQFAATVSQADKDALVNAAIERAERNIRWFGTGGIPVDERWTATNASARRNPWPSSATPSTSRATSAGWVGRQS